MARDSSALAKRRSILGWLYTCTRFAAAKAQRAKARRIKYETADETTEHTMSPPNNLIQWSEVRVVIDASMHELKDADREALLLRFFEGYSLKQLGEATGLVENAARMRVDRALEKLRVKLARRGITTTASALAGAIIAQPVVAVPVGLETAVAGFALAGMAGTSATTAFLPTLLMTKAKAVSLAAALSLTTGGLIWMGVDRSRVHTSSREAMPAALPAQAHDGRELVPLRTPAKSFPSAGQIAAADIKRVDRTLGDRSRILLEYQYVLEKFRTTEEEKEKLKDLLVEHAMVQQDAAAAATKNGLSPELRSKVINDAAQAVSNEILLYFGKERYEEFLYASQENNVIGHIRRTYAGAMLDLGFPLTEVQTTELGILYADTVYRSEISKSKEAASVDPTTGLSRIEEFFFSRLPSVVSHDQELVMRKILSQRNLTNLRRLAPKRE